MTSIPRVWANPIIICTMAVSLTSSPRPLTKDLSILMASAGSRDQSAERATRARGRPAAWLAWLIWTAIVVFGATLLVRLDARWYWYVLTHYFWRYPEDYGDVLASGIVVLALPAYATVGAVVASLRPKNAVGWICLFLSILLLVASWQPTDVAMADRVEVLNNLAWLLLMPPLPVTLMLLVFPDGRPPSRRWWAVAATAVAGTILVALAAFLPAYPAVGLAGVVGFSGSMVAAVASVVAVLLRWRRSRNRERQQIKLLAYAVALTIAAVAIAAASSYIFDDIPGAQSYPTVLAIVVGFAGMGLGIPLAIGIAMLKHRLYDVDLLINRTLVYGSLTAFLALAYFGGRNGYPGRFANVHQAREATATRHRGLYPSHRRAVHPLEAVHPVFHRQALLPPQVRCKKDPRSLFIEAARRDGARYAEHRASRRGESDDAARPGGPVAQEAAAQT